MGVPTVEETAAQVVRLLSRQGRTVAVAESLTGGLVVAALVGVPGASKVVRGGVVAYMTDLKASLLGVDEALLARVGAVDPDVAAAMARGVAVRLGADYGLATTGVAGPDPQDGHPVGEVHIAVWDATRTDHRDADGTDAADGTDHRAADGTQASDRITTVVSLLLDPTLDRATIRATTVEEALTLLCDTLGS